MMVEMDRPFVWPQEPENFDLYVQSILFFAAPFSCLAQLGQNEAAAQEQILGLQAPAKRTCCCSQPAAIN